jgi:hypothetical protein
VGLMGTLTAIVGGLVFGVLWGAVGGAAYAWYLNRNNPSTPTAPPPM